MVAGEERCQPDNGEGEGRERCGECCLTDTETSVALFCVSLCYFVLEGVIVYNYVFSALFACCSLMVF